ncbi:MAG: M28 family peptidase [Pseudomonadota bacterium]
MFPYQPLLEKSSAAVALAAVLLIASLSWLALRPLQPPAPLGGDTPAAEFAASRALPVFRFLAQAPRPIASASNARTRQYIVERLQSLELEPQVHSASAQSASVGFLADARVHAGVVHNIVVRKSGSAPGHARRPALLLATHYDSAPDQIGAADAGALVAAMLETLRALQHGAPLANDVIFLFTDGEKSGALGARAFAEQHPWARDVGLVLQFDAAGNTGALLLTGARGGNGQLVDGWIAKAPLAAGSSALALLARQAPALAGGPLDQVGPAGMRFANIEGSTGYRASFDVAAQVAPATLQHAGETMLALTRHFGNRPLADIASADQVYFTLPLVGQVHYTVKHVWALTRLVCLMFLLACCLAVKHMDMTGRALLTGAMAFLLLAFALALAALSLWKGLPGLHAGYNPIASGAGARDHWYVLAYVTLGVALFIELQRLLHKAIGSPATTLGALLVLVAALVAASWAAPGASYLLAWPLIATLLAYGLLHAPAVAALPHALRVALLVAGMTPAVLLVAPLLQQVATLFTAERSALLMLLLAAMLGMGSTLLAATRRRFVAPLLLLACVGAVVTAQGTRQYDADMARPNRMTYLNDATSWKAWWVMPAEPLDAWSRPFFAEAKLGPRELREVVGMTRAEQWVARAPARKVAYPDIVVLKDDTGGGRRQVVFTLRSQNDAPTIDVRVEGADTLAARLDGKLLTERLARTWKLSLHGTGSAIHTVELDLSPDTIARVYVEERIPGLPGGLGGARPAHTPLTEMTVSSDMLVFR